MRDHMYLHGVVCVFKDDVGLGASVNVPAPLCLWPGLASTLSEHGLSIYLQKYADFQV